MYLHTNQRLGQVTGDRNPEEAILQKIAKGGLRFQSAVDGKPCDFILPPTAATSPYIPAHHPESQAYWGLPTRERERVTRIVDAAFTRATSISRKLNPKLSSDMPWVRIWLTLRDIVMTCLRKRQQPQDVSATCGPFLRVKSFNDYSHLVLCAERALPQYTPRQMLSLLRQLYYGDNDWSVNQLTLWRDVIPCGLRLQDPRLVLGQSLFKALQDSKVVGDTMAEATDVGHVFTCLEAMFCPMFEVKLQVPAINWVVKMPNFEFASWGGDLGSAVAQKVHDEQDLRMNKQEWSRYFGGTNTLANEPDLNGDIDGYLIGSSLTSDGCPSLPRTRTITISIPISRVIHEYYTQVGSSFGRSRLSRIPCFVQTLGGVIARRRITNKTLLVEPIGKRVYSFAEAFYKLKFHKGYFATPGIGSWLLSYSYKATKLFLDWLEAKL